MNKTIDALVIIGISLLVISFLAFISLAVLYMGQGEESIPATIKVIVATTAFTGTMLFVIPLQIVTHKTKE